MYIIIGVQVNRQHPQKNNNKKKRIGSCQPVQYGCRWLHAWRRRETSEKKQRISCRKHTLWCGKPQAQLLSRKVWEADLTSMCAMIHATNQLVFKTWQPRMLLPSVVSVNSSSNNASDCEKSRCKKASDQMFYDHRPLCRIWKKTIDVNTSSWNFTWIKSNCSALPCCFSIPVPPLPQAAAASSGPQSP